MENIIFINTKIINWGKNGIDNFPWRNPGTLYESAVAEIMLIRTPAKQVLDVYNKFIKIFPDEHQLAKSNKDIIVDIIRPLGLKRRAKMLKDMSDYLVKNNGFDKKTISINKLKKIPGIGNYTAAAIMTFYYKQRAIPIDSNTIRFFERFYNKEFDKDVRRNKNFYKKVDKLVPDSNDKAVSFNVSFLDFMRKICKPKKPKCISCPLAKRCDYHYNYLGVDANE